MEKEKTKWKCLSSAFKQRSPTGPQYSRIGSTSCLPFPLPSAASVYGGWEWKAWETLGRSSLKSLYLVVRDFALRRESIWHVTKSCESTGIWKGAYHSIVVCSPPYLKYFCNTYIYKIPSLFSSLWSIQFLWCKWSIPISFLTRLSESLCPTLLTSVYMPPSSSLPSSSILLLILLLPKFPKVFFLNYFLVS